MSLLDPRDGWHPDGSGDCTGCGTRTVCGIVEGERRLPLCPECAEVLRERPEERELLLARRRG